MALSTGMAMLGGTIGSAVIGAFSSRRASKEQTRGIKSGISAEERMSERNLEFQREMADQQREDFAPWREVGQQALDQIWEGVQTGAFEIGRINLEDDPGFQVRMQEGIRARDASASARGRLLSGAQDRANIRYAQEQGSQEYANAYAREVGERDTRFNILRGLASQGQASAAGQAGATSQLATTGGNIMSQTGRAQNVARQNVGNVRAGAYQDYGTIVNNAAQNWLTYKGVGGSGGSGSGVSNNQFVRNNANVFGGS